MTDIDTIREALERYRILTRPGGEDTGYSREADRALSALERVSALQAEMEDVLQRIIRDREVTLAPKEVRDTFALLLRAKESR